MAAYGANGFLFEAVRLSALAANAAGRCNPTFHSQALVSTAVYQKTKTSDAKAPDGLGQETKPQSQPKVPDVAFVHESKTINAGSDKDAKVTATQGLKRHGTPEAQELLPRKPHAEGAVDPLGSPSPTNGKRKYPVKATVGDGVEVKTSTLPNAGNGLFVTRDMPKDSLVTKYEGELITRDEARQRRDRHAGSHLRSIDNCWVIDGSTNKSDNHNIGGGSFANDPRDPSKVNVRFQRIPVPYPTPSSFQKRERVRTRRNLTATLCSMNTICLKALRDLVAGEELFVSYGKHYWNTTD